MTYLTVRDVAGKLAVSARTVERWVASGDLFAVKFGPKLTRIRPSDLEAFEARQCQTTASSDPSSTEDNPTSGTSAGAKDAGAVVSLRRRLTR